MAKQRYWVFQCNPEMYDFAGDVKVFCVGARDTWSVKKYRTEIQAGDAVAIWQSGSTGGVYAFGKVLTAPYKLRQHLRYQIDNGLADLPLGYAVDYEVTSIFPEGIRREAIQGDERLSGLSIMKMPLGTNFKVTLQEWLALQDLGEVLPPAVTPPIPTKSYVEGQKRLVTHLQTERASGLAAAKRADFIKKNGYLYCEKCGVNPIEQYGEFGLACIEVHHRNPLGYEKSAINTVLEDLECLCANCHRIEHARIRAYG